jgi:signal transduction histidine kinase
MPFSIRTKQVAGVMAIVTFAVLVLVGWYLGSLTKILLQGARSQAAMLSNVIYQRSFNVVSRGTDPIAALRDDDGLRSVLESYAFGEGMAYASICDTGNRITADADPTRVGTRLAPVDHLSDLEDLIDRQGTWAQLRAIMRTDTLEFRERLALGGADLGSIRIGVSTWLLQTELKARLKGPLIAGAIVVIASSVVAVFLAQLVLRPIHIIRSGLARLGRGELDVAVDLPPDAELSDLGASFKQVTARLSADRTEREGQRALESVLERLEDAVALFGTDGALLFSNAAMDAVLGLPDAPDAPKEPRPHVDDLLAADHPYRIAVERALQEGVPEASPMHIPDAGERLVLANVVPGTDGRPMGVLLVSRNLAYISQVESTLSYSRKLGALNRLTAGIAHEIKNPLNATMIHLELLRIQLADRQQALEHLGVIANQVRRLDEVVQGFLKFTRPEDLKLEPVDLPGVFESLSPVVQAEATKHRVDLKIDVPATLPAVEGDANLLEQAFLNLALNACQAMPNGGSLRIGAKPTSDHRVTITVEDTGIGISKEHMSRVFDLYFTTKKNGSGIGLSLVFRTVQLHNGEIELESTPGAGTTFRIKLRQASRIRQAAGR